MDTVKVGGVVYAVEATDRCEGLPALRADLDRRGIEATLTIRRPKGRRVSMAYRMRDGRVVIVATV